MEIDEDGELFLGYCRDNHPRCIQAVEEAHGTENVDWLFPGDNGEGMS